MSSQGNNNILQGIPNLGNAFVILITTEWNETFTSELCRGAIQVFETNKINFQILTVPGAVEIPFAISAYKQSNKPQPDAFIAFGMVIRGGTPHFDYVCKSVTEGITNLNLKGDVPVIFGVLTLDNEQQGHERLGGIHGHKGIEAAITAIKMIDFKRSLSQP